MPVENNEQSNFTYNYQETLSDNYKIKNLSPNFNQTLQSNSSNHLMKNAALFLVSTAFIINPLNNIVATKMSNLDKKNVYVASLYSSTYYKDDDIISMNNDKLEVEDLADKVTQSQLDEVKDHFDTKLQTLHTNVKNDIKNAIEELKEEMKNNRKNVLSKWWTIIGFILTAFIAPVITGLIVAHFAK